MSEENVERARESDAPLSAAVHQRDVGHEAAEARGWHEAAVIGRTVTINKPRGELTLSGATSGTWRACWRTSNASMSATISAPTG
jgi:hypothetical protein